MLADLDGKSKGIIHNDLHPRNIFVKDGKKIVLIDWGEARQGLPETDYFRSLVAFDYHRDTEREARFLNQLYSAIGNKGMETYAQCKLHGLIRLANYACKEARVSSSPEKKIALPGYEKEFLTLSLPVIDQTGVAFKLDGLKSRIERRLRKL